MKDAAVIEVLEEYAERLQEWYKKTAADDTKEEVISRKLGMQEVLDVFDRQGLIGIWTAHQESEIVGDPNCSRAGHGNEFSWRLSIPTVKAAFMDSQERISLYLPISPYISLHLPTSPYISLYLPISPAFMDSQSGEQLGAAQASATDEMALLSFPEFQELVARVGLDKYRPIKAMTPAAAVRAMHQNILGEKNEEQVTLPPPLTLALTPKHPWREE